MATCCGCKQAKTQKKDDSAPKLEESKTHSGTGDDEIKDKSLIALNDYNAGGATELMLTKGKRLQFIEYDETREWVLVKEKETEKIGYVPKEFVAEANTLKSEDWYFGDITRREAENILCRSDIQPGTFLVRLAADDKTELLILSVRSVLATDKVTKLVDHFCINKIKEEDSPGGYQLSVQTEPTFPTVKELINHYKEEQGDLLSCLLTKSAVRRSPSRRELCRVTAQVWEIDRSEVTLGNKLGQGAYAEVFRGEWCRSGCIPISVAVKQVKQGSMGRMEFVQEAATMKQLNHAHLVSLYGVCADRDPFWIITELMVNGALLEFLKKPSRMSRRAMLDVCCQVARAMVYLDHKRLVHRDLAARNVLVGELYYGIPRVKLSDLGLAKVLDEGQQHYKMTEAARMPTKWLALECIERHEFTNKSDVWAFGVLMYEVFTAGAMPYADIPNSRQLYEYIKGGGRLAKPQRMPDNVYEQLLIYWSADPELRPTFTEVVMFLEDLGTSSCSITSRQTNV